MRMLAVAISFIFVSLAPGQGLWLTHDHPNAYLVVDGEKRWLPNMGLVRRLRLVLNFKYVDAEVLERLPEKAPLNDFEPLRVMIKRRRDSRVYLTKGLQYHLIPDEESFYYYGLSWRHVVELDDFSPMVEGDPYLSVSRFRNLVHGLYVNDDDVRKFLQGISQAAVVSDNAEYRSAVEERLKVHGRGAEREATLHHLSIKPDGSFEAELSLRNYQKVVLTQVLIPRGKKLSREIRKCLGFDYTIRCNVRGNVLADELEYMYPNAVLPLKPFDFMYFVATKR